MTTRLGLRHPRDEQGAIAILTALLMVVLILCAAIVVDLGNARDVRRQSQNAADAASLAGANALYPSTKVCTPPVAGGPPCIADAEAAVRAYALTNFQVSSTNWSACIPPSGSALAYVKGDTSCISYNSATDPDTVRVFIPTRTIRTFFGGITGRSSIAVSSTASASLRSGTKCSLCILGDVDAGNGDFSVFGGAIAVNGDVQTSAGSGSVWNSTGNGIAGNVSGPGSSPSGAVFTPPKVGIPHFGDPLANSLKLPLDLTGLGLTNKTDPCSAGAPGGPGLYGAFSLPNSACTLKPGLYVISGTWDMKSSTVLSGPGVTLYVKAGGALDFKNGNLGDPLAIPPVVGITSMSTGVTKGYAIIYDPGNSSAITLQGNGGTGLAGIVYAPNNIVELNGTSCFGFNGGPIVIGGVKMNGTTGCVDVANAVDTNPNSILLHLNQ